MCIRDRFITVLLVPLAGLAARLRAEMKARGYHVDARLYAYAAGLELAAAAPTTPAAPRLALAAAAGAALAFAAFHLRRRA